jgi:hypothetical protein
MNVNCIVFDLTRLDLDHTIYHTGREHVNQYTVNIVKHIKNSNAIIM